MRALFITIIACAPALALAQPIDNSHSLIERGRYLAQAGDCAACHTADGGKPFAGGRAVPTPFGTIYSTNITPDKDTGIGGWSEDDFWRAMHDGIRRDGKHLYPAFPYPWYTHLSRADVDALDAYLGALPAVRQENKPSKLPFPLSVRESVAGWNAMFFDAGQYRPDAKRSAQWNRGAYLVEGLGHCGACHTAKNFLGGPEKSRTLAGGFGEDWYAPALTNAGRDGLGHWSEQQLVEYLKTGTNAKSHAVGPMAEVVQHSTQHLSDADLHSVAVYLKSLPGDEKERAAEDDHDRLARGAALYVDQCAGCHMARGEGQPGVFPSLADNAIVQARDPGTLLHTILEGGHTVATAAKPTALAMPAFDWKLSNTDIADLATWLRASWGNRAAPVSDSSVEKTRERVLHAALASK